MANARLASKIEVAGLIRKIEGEGGFGAVLRRGDPQRGALLIVVRSRGDYVASLERMLTLDGNYRWERVGPAERSDPQQVAEFVEKRIRFDEDAWVLELDIAQPERFIAETTSMG